MKKKKYDVYISYRQKDGTDKARCVEQGLKSYGINCFLDRNIPGGEDDLNEAMKNAQQEAPIFIAVMTDEYLNIKDEQDSVFKELNNANTYLEGDKIKNNIVLVYTEKSVKNTLNENIFDKVKNVLRQRKYFYGLEYDLFEERLHDLANNIKAFLNNIKIKKLYSIGLLFGRPALFIDNNINREKSSHNSAVRSLQINPQKKQFISASDDGTIKLWDINTLDVIATIHNNGGSIKSVSYSNDYTYIVAGINNQIKVWELTNGTFEDNQEPMIIYKKAHNSSIKSVIFSPDNNYIISTSDDQTIKIWKINNNKILSKNKTLSKHTECVRSARYSKSGKLAVSASEDNSVRIWDTSDWTCIYRLPDHTKHVNFAQFSPDENFIATASDDKTIKIWKIEKDKNDNIIEINNIDTLEGHNNEVNTVEYDSTGKYLISTSSDCTIKIWDSSTGECLETLQEHDYGVRAALFYEQENTIKGIISASDDTKIRIWKILNINKQENS